MKHARYQDMLVVVGRASKGFKKLFQRDYLPIIMATTRTAWLVMLWASDISSDSLGSWWNYLLVVRWPTYIQFTMKQLGGWWSKHHCLAVVGF